MSRIERETKKAAARGRDCKHCGAPARVGLRYCHVACATCAVTDHDDAFLCAGLCRRDGRPGKPGAPKIARDMTHT